MRRARLVLLFFVGIGAAQALCPPIGEPTCLPNQELAQEYYRAVVNSFQCVDTHTVKPDGTLNERPAPPNLLTAFVRQHGDSAILLYEGAAKQCGGTVLQTDSIRALASLQSPSGRDALERLRHESSWLVRAVIVRAAVVDDPAMRSLEQVDPLWRGEKDSGVRHTLASALLQLHDPQTLPSIRAWTEVEGEPGILKKLELARTLIEHPGQCALQGSEWQQEGRVCGYTCEGKNFDVSDSWVAWNLLPCPAVRPQRELVRAWSEERWRIGRHRRWALWGLSCAAALIIVAALWQSASMYRRSRPPKIVS